MSDYNYLPCDGVPHLAPARSVSEIAAHAAAPPLAASLATVEAALVEAMHTGHAPDSGDYTTSAPHGGGSIPSPLWVENQRLRAALAAATQRAEAAEAALAQLEATP